MAKTLFDCAEKQSLIIIGVNKNYFLFLRLLELGFVQNTAVKVIKVSPKRNVFLLELRGYLISLRKDAVQNIFVK